MKKYFTYPLGIISSTMKFLPILVLILSLVALVVVAEDQGSLKDRLKNKLMSMMEEDLAGCPGPEAKLSDLSFTELGKPQERCIESCAAQTMGFDGKFKYQGSTVVCCCVAKK